jgi:hypothetical protein
VINDIAIGAFCLVFVVVMTLLGMLLRGRGRERTASLEAEREYDSDQPAARAHYDPADADDLYPAQPPLPGAAGPDAAPAGQARPVDAVAAAAASETARQALAQATHGETILEEIEALEARLRVLYDRLGEEIAADIELVSAELASGRLAVAEWLPA